MRGDQLGNIFIISQKRDSEGFWQIANSVFNKSKCTMFLLLNDPVLISSASIKQNCFAKIFSKISDLDHSNISSLVFPSRTYLKLHNISVSPKMVQKVVQTLIHTSWNFHICLKVSCFSDCWKVSLVVPVLKNVGERRTARSYCPVSLLSVVRKTCK